MIHWRTLILALFLTLILLSVWEVTCRNNGFLPTMDDDKYLWAAQRDRVRDHDSSQVVIIGASRAHFDFQLDDWEDVTGIRPLQLAADGKSPGPVLQDIVNNTAFNGTIVMNITPSLFLFPPLIPSVAGKEQLIGSTPTISGPWPNGSITGCPMAPSPSLPS